jgi:hypothetical protein
MKTKRSKVGMRDDLAALEHELHHESGAVLDASALSGAIAGAVIGSIAGPPGVVAGGIIGTALGVVAGVGLDNAERVHGERDKELDEDIGVTKGNLGAADPTAPPPRRGTYSSASAGVSMGGGSPSEGPMSNPTD